MYTFKIDKDTGDLAFDGQNNIAIVSGNDEQDQAVRVLLSTNAGEWFLNPSIGLAYKYLQVKNPDVTRIRAELTTALEQDSRVQSVNQLTVDFDNLNRKLSINFSLTMSDGNTVTGNEVINI